MKNNSLILVCVGLLLVFLPNKIQDITAAFGILSVGILHGANDLSIIKQLFNQSSRKVNRNFIRYLAVVFGGILLFYFLPTLALPVFVVVSSYHFGEQHFEKHNFRYVKQTSVSLYGGLIFSLIFLTHIDETIDIIDIIVGQRLPELFLWIGFAICSTGTIISLWANLSAQEFWRELLLLGGLALFFFKASLLMAFGFYFCLFHAFPSLRSQLKFLFNEVSWQALQQYIRHSLAYWILALVGLGGVYSFVEWDLASILPLFFIFLASITFPHVVVMGFLFRELETKK